MVVPRQRGVRVRPEVAPALCRALVRASGALAGAAVRERGAPL